MPFSIYGYRAFSLAAHALTLEEGLKIVAETGRDASIARSNEEAARSGVSIARAARLPRMNAFCYETWLWYKPAALFGNQSVATAQDRFLAYWVTATQLLYDFGGPRHPSTPPKRRKGEGNRD